MAPSPEDPEVITAETPTAPEGEPTGFRVSLGNFDGPFDLLLTLLGTHELDITEISLSKVTDEFISYLKGLESDDELDQASEFLVVAATLLDMKVAGLLPQGELVDAESVALLEARDLLFARLLQYRAFKEVSAWFERASTRSTVVPFRSSSGRCPRRTSQPSRCSPSHRRRFRTSDSTTSTRRSCPSASRPRSS